MINSYSKVYTVGHKAIADLFSDTVLVEEKIDGSQFSFGLIDGELQFRSRKVNLVENPADMFQPAIETVKSIREKLMPDWIYRGEFLSKPKHNVLAYDRIPKGFIIIFDIDMNGLMNYLSYDDKILECSRIGLECVPKLYHGKVDNFEDFMQLLETKSCLGVVNVEGIVIKNYERFTRDGKTVMGKFVREDFKEKHNKDWKKTNPGGKDIIETLGAIYKAEARWEKAVQHLKEKGQLEGEPKDIGLLIREVQNDIQEECKDEISEKLFKWAWGKISRKVTSGLPEWYKEKLAKNAFNEK
jgi:hypothetical protein